MATPVFLDRVMETSLTSGTGAYTLIGAVKGYQPFSAIGDGNQCYYAAYDTLTGWEVGLGTYTLATKSLSRNQILASSNHGNPVVWLPIPKFVWLDAPAVLMASIAVLAGGAVDLPLVSNGINEAPSFRVLPIDGGGTGETDANSALNALLPSQGTNSGKVLTTDGTDASWQAISGPVNAASFGFVPGTGTDADLAAAIAAAAASPTGVLQINGGDYTGLLSQTDFSTLNGIELLGDVTFDYSSATNVANFTLGGFVNIIGGNLVALPALSADIAIGDEQMVFSSDPGLSKGDIVVIWNPTASSYSGFRTYYYAGEYAVISDTASAPTYYRFGGAYAAYAAASVNLYKHAAKQFTVSGPGVFKIIESTNSTLHEIAGVEARFLAHFDLSKFQPTNSGYAGIDVDRCYDMFGTGYKVNQSRFDGGSVEYYGISIGNTQNVVIDGDFYGGRHAVTTGGKDATGAVPCRNGIVRGNFANDYQSSFTICAADMHGNTEYWRYEGIFNGGATIAGNHNSLEGKFRTHTAQQGIAIEGSELSGTDHSIKGEVYTQGAPGANAGGRGVVDIAGNSTAIGTNTASGGTIDLSGLKFYAPHADHLVVVRNQGYTGSDPINVDVSGVTWQATDAASPVMFIISAAAGNAINCVRMSDHYNGPNAGYSITATKIRGWRAAGSVTITPTTSEAAASVTVSYNAPKAPSVTVQMNAATMGGAVCTTFTGAVGTTSCSVGGRTCSGSNFGATTAASFSWEAMIEDV